MMDLSLYKTKLTPLKIVKQHVFNLQRCGIGNDLKQSTPSGCGFKPLKELKCPILILQGFKSSPV